MSLPYRKRACSQHPTVLCRLCWHRYTAQSSIPALQAALEAVRPGGVVSAILYSGQVIGTDEKQTVLEYLRALPLKSFTVLVCDFANWAETAPLPCIILKK